MDKRILAVLVGVLAGAGAASAQPTYSTGGGGATRAIQSPERDRAQTGPSGTSRAPVAAAGATRMAPSEAYPPGEGYVISGSRTAVVNNERECVHAGSWTAARAAEPCDAVPHASTPAPVVAAAPEPQPAPAPETPAPAPRVIEKVTLSTDVLFAFNQAELLPGGKDKLDQLAQDAQGADVDRVVLAGYADRIGAEQYNRDLSERRAQAVADYLASKGVDKSRIQVEGHGEDNSITGDQCTKMGPERASNKKLVACLQPDRRVEAELLGSREVAGTAAAPAGATSGGTTGSSSSGTSGGETPNGSSSQ